MIDRSNSILTQQRQQDIARNQAAIHEAYLQSSQRAGEFPRNDTKDVLEWVRPLPEVFIFRRTKKTGTSSMMAALLDELPKFGYTPVNTGDAEVEIPLRHELIRSKGRRIMLVRHNHITRNIHPTRSAIIADTIRDGFERWTSFCRYIRRIETCDFEIMKECWQSEESAAERKYRWAGRNNEDSDNYIDLPMSSAHPALSTTIMRTVYPTLTLQLERYNVKGSNCPETPELRKLYNESFPHQDEEDELLRKRMLMISGYPYQVHTNVGRELNMTEMLDAAELIEKSKYGMTGEMKVVKAMSGQARKMRSGDLKWVLDKNGKLIPATRKEVPGV